MSPAELLAHPLSQAVTWTLLHFVWQGLVIAAALVAVVALLRLRRPADRHLCSLTALLLMAACPLATLAWQSARSQESGVRSQEPGHSPLTTHHSPPTLSPPLTTHHSPTHLLQAAQPYVLAAWLTGVALLGGRLLLGLAGIRRLRNSRLPLPPDLANRADELCRRLAMGRRRLVFLSQRVSEAVAVGFVRPIVLIPAAWATEMPLAMLEAVIAHELAHLRRQDLWVNLLQRIVETLLFYHPAVWWLSRRLRTERELCCDELAVAATGQRLVYVQALEQVARRHAAGVQPVLAAGIRGERNMRLLERVRNVLGLSAAENGSRLWPAGLLALALPLGAWAWSAGLISDPVAAVADDEEGKEKEVAKEKEREDGKEREEKEVRKDGERKDGERKDVERKEEVRKDGDKREIRIEIRREEVRKDGDNPEAARIKRERAEELKFFGKEGEARKDGDRPVKEGPRDGEVKRPGPRDGEKPVKEGPRDGDKPGKDGERKIVRDGDKQAKDMEAYVRELTALVKKLQVENERLRAELAGRGEKVKEPARDKEGAAREKEEAARDKEAAPREREADIKRGNAEKEEAIRRAIRAKELDGEKESAERKELEARERKIKEAAAKEGAFKEGGDKEAAIRRERELAERKKAEFAERAAKEKEAAVKAKEDR